MAGKELELARELYRKHKWTQSFDQYLRVYGNKNTHFESSDIKCLAITAYLIGKDDISSEIWSRAFKKYLDQSNTEQAARCAFWLGFQWMMKGQHARGSGWINRARRLLEDRSPEGASWGFLQLPQALRCLGEENNKEAYELFTHAEELGIHYRNPELKTLACMGRGQALIRLGDIQKGVTLLDESMISLDTEELSPVVVGIVYCAVIESCREIYDLQRAQEWTDALNEWCNSQPDLVPYRGQCLIRRAEIMQLHGSWEAALKETDLACTQLTQPPGEPAAGEAYYRKGELHRLHGNFKKAEEAYRQASQYGHQTQPGLALLRLAEGNHAQSIAAIKRIYDEAKGRLTRSRILPAYIEIMLATNEIEEAHTAVNELSEITDTIGAPYLQALTFYYRGAVLLEKNDTPNALTSLQNAQKKWKDLDSPYELARTKVLISRTCNQLDDTDTAHLEKEAAQSIFRQLGAQPDLDRIIAKTRYGRNTEVLGLTSRELEVLQLVASGKTNKAIANELFISVRTVDRHVSNIFNKLGVNSRTAATSFAYEHDLL